VGAWVLVCGVASAALGRPSIRIVDHGQPRAVIVTPADADKHTQAAARLLAEYVKKSSGAELPVAAEPTREADRHRVAIHVGPCAYTKRLALKIDKLDADGFVLRTVDPRHVVIAGPTPYGTEFGVCEFLERYVGVRWLMPGPDGEDVPAHKTLDIPCESVRQEPAFFSRLFSGLQGPAQSTWARRNRMHGRVSFHHNLIHLFPPETYKKSHPEFFPLRKGKRFLPATNSTHGWQPCFSADGLVEEAIKNINRYFDQNPSVPSYSLGVNDSGGHCQCQRCRAQDPNEKNFLGRRDVSDRYFAWCNRVIEGVLKKHPDKVFGCLAYSEVAQPPSRVKVHPRLIPYMTYDRMKWVDPKLRATGEEMTKRWHAASPTVGWYDYIYGAAYCVPRVWFHAMADYYRFGHAHGVRALYAEAYPNWGEGPKLYVSLKLQWNPKQDVDRLLREWTVRCVGPDAANDLAAYYALWEDFWTRRILRSTWYTQRGQYLHFNNPAYLADVTDKDIATSRTLLEQVLAKAGTAKQKARAKTLLWLFEYYEASAVAYRARGKAAAMQLRTEADALRALDLGQRCLRMAARRQRLMQKEFAKPPRLVRHIDFDRYPLLRGTDWGTGMLYLAIDWVGKSPAVRERLVQLAASDHEGASLTAKTMLKLADKDARPISKNPSFENAAGRWPSGWASWVKWGVGTETASPKAARTGKLGILCKGVKRGGPHQSLPVTPGRYAAVAFVRVPKATRGAATVTLTLTFLDGKGQNLPGGLSNEVRVAPGNWRQIAIAGATPAPNAGRTPRSARLLVIVNGFDPSEEVHIDDVALYRID